MRIIGREFPIKAEVVQLQSFSGHADADEILRWMRGASRPPAMTYVTHGEPSASDTLRGRIEHELGWPARAPEHLDIINLDKPR